MGAALSAATPPEAEEAAAAAAPPALPFEVPGSPARTTVLALGRAAPGALWHVAGGRRAFPYPPGFRAAAQLYGRAALLGVELGAPGAPGAPPPPPTRFVVLVQGGAGGGEFAFEGSTPTAPLAKLALALGRLDVPRGLEAWGFADARVRGALVRAAAAAGDRAAPLAQLEPGAAVGAWAAGLDPTSPPGAEAPAPPAPRAAPARPPPRPPRPAAAAVEAHAAALAGRPLSLARRRPASAAGGGGKGYTAFTGECSSALGRPVEAENTLLIETNQPNQPTTNYQPLPPPKNTPVFGIEERDAVRRAMPWAPAVEVEKRVGARWAALGAAERAHFAAVAAEMRRGAAAAAAAAAAAEGGEDEGDEGGEARHAASDAGAEERRLRPYRRQTPAAMGEAFEAAAAEAEAAAAAARLALEGLSPAEAGGLELLAALASESKSEAAAPAGSQSSAGVSVEVRAAAEEEEEAESGHA
jgi:hypothetical protein